MAVILSENSHLYKFIIKHSLFFPQKFCNSLKSPLPNPLTGSSLFNKDPRSAGAFTDLSSNGIVLQKLDYNSEATKYPANGFHRESAPPPNYSESGDGLYPHLNDDDEEYWGRKNLLNGENNAHNRV